jgi:hypothetical protein
LIIFAFDLELLLVQ